MTVPHDPAHLARLSYTRGDEHWHLMADDAVVVVISATVSRGIPHASDAEAEAEFQKGVSALIAERNPGWSVWTSDEGRWYATRLARLTREEIRAGFVPTVTAETPNELDDDLAEQPHSRQAIAS